MGAGGSSNKKIGDGVAPPSNAAAASVRKVPAATATAPPAPVTRGSQLRVIIRHLKPGEMLSLEVGRVIEGGSVALRGGADAVGLMPPPPPEANCNGTVFGWFVEDPDNLGRWEPYSRESADRLEDAFLHMRDTCTVVMKKHTYTVNLTKMQQLLPAGGSTAASAVSRTREVKRVPVVQCTDPATGNVVLKEAPTNLIDPFAEEDGGEGGEGERASQVIAQGAGDTAGGGGGAAAASSSAATCSPTSLYDGSTAALRGLPHLIRTIVPHSSPIYTMETTPSVGQLCPEARAVADPAGGALVLSSGRDCKLLEWSLDTSRVITKYELPGITDKNSVLTAKYSATGKWVIAGLDDRTARLYAIGNPNEIHRLEGHTHKVYGAGILAGDRQAVTASMDCRVKVWDIATGTCVHTIIPHKSHIFALRPHPTDANFALTAGEDRTVCMHDFRQENSVVGIFTGHEQTIWDVDWNPVESTFASCGIDSTMRIYDPRVSTIAAQTLRSHTKPVHSLTYTPHGRGLLSCSKDFYVNLTGTDDWMVRWQAKAHAATVFRVRYHAGKEVMLTAASDSSVNVWTWKAVNQL
jgi:WD40 repeat protein